MMVIALAEKKRYPFWSILDSIPVFMSSIALVLSQEGSICPCILGWGGAAEPLLPFNQKA